MGKYLCENPKFLKDFKEWLFNEKKKTISNSTTSGNFITKYGCWDGLFKLERTIIFYEWSTLDGSKRIFNNLQKFYDFLEECKIKFPDYSIRKIIEENQIIYMTCKPSQAELIANSSYKDLKKSLNLLKR